MIVAAHALRITPRPGSQTDQSLCVTELGSAGLPTGQVQGVLPVRLVGGLEDCIGSDGHGDPAEVYLEECLFGLWINQYHKTTPLCAVTNRRGDFGAMEGGCSKLLSPSKMRGRADIWFYDYCRGLHGQLFERRMVDNGMDVFGGPATTNSAIVVSV